MKKIVKLFVSATIIFLLTATTFAGEKVYFYHTDAAGTPMAMTDSSGNVVWRVDYKPFGEEQSITGTIENNEKFIGKEKDKETGLYYFGARYLGPKIGRFITVDPMRAVNSSTSITNETLLLNPQKLNLYSYSLNNPYRYIDPDGRTPWDIVDVGFFSYSLYRFAKEPSWSNAGDLGLDTVGLLPIVPSLGMIKRVGEGIDKASKVGKTVLGHYPDYLKLADEIGARRLNIPTEIWKNIPDAEKWAANQKFLDRAIRRGDEIILATPADKAKSGSFFERELNYLQSKGYKVSEDKIRLIPGN